MSKSTLFLLTVVLLLGTFPGSMNVLGAEESISEAPIIIQAEDYIDCGKGLTPDMNPLRLNFSLEEGFGGATVREADDIDGGYYVERVAKEGWLSYAITVPQSGWYCVDARVASVNDGAFRMTIGDTLCVRPQGFPGSGDSPAWKTIHIPGVYLPGGTDVLRFISQEDNLNVNWISFTMSTQVPYSGSATIIPGIVEAEKYDWGGEGVAYHDTTAGNICYYDAFRYEDVDVENSPVSGSIINVGWIDEGEWLEFIIYARYRARYYPHFVVAAPWGGRATLDLPNWRGTFSFSTDGGNQDYESFDAGWIDLYPGAYLIRVTAVQELWNFDKLIFYFQPYIPPSSAQVPLPEEDRAFLLDKPYPLAVDEPLELK